MVFQRLRRTHQHQLKTSTDSNGWPKIMSKWLPIHSYRNRTKHDPQNINNLKL